MYAYGACSRADGFFRHRERALITPAPAPVTLSVALPATLPVTLIGGYLGAGKTTLINYLLREANGLRLAVLVNDFGDINIDVDLIESQTADVISLAGGCVCCSFGNDLMSTLSSLADLNPQPEHVLIETSGVALPAAVARSLRLVPTLSHDGTVVLVDSETVRAKAQDRYVGETVTEQLRAADLIILNKADLVSEQTLDELYDWLEALVPRAAILDCERAEVDPQVVFDGPTKVDAVPGSVSGAASDAGSRRTRSLLSGRLGRMGSMRPARQHFQSISLEFVGRIDPQPLTQALLDPALNLFRAKALAQDSQGRGVLIQIVGTRSEVVPSNHRNPERGRLVCIGARGGLDQSAVEAVLQTALQNAASKDATSIDATSVDATPIDATPKVSRVD